MSEEYLAHSKGPWKKHKYIKKVGNKYYYKSGTGLISDNTKDAYWDTRNRVENELRDAKSKAKAGVTNAINKATGTTASQRRAKVRVAKRSASKALNRAGRSATNAINKATGTTASQRRAKVRVAKYNVNKAVNSGMAAINKLFGKAKSTAKRVGAQAKNKAYATPYLANAYKDKAKFAVSDAKKAAKKVKNTAQRKAAIAKGRVKDLKGKQQVRNLNKIRKNVAKAKKKHNSNA